MSNEPEQPLFVKIAPGVRRMNSTRIGTIDITLPAPSHAGERYGLLPTNRPVVVNGTWKIEPGASMSFVSAMAEMGYLYWEAAPSPPASPPPASDTGEAAATGSEVRADE